MTILEDLKNTDNWSIRYGLWDKLFVGEHLFQELSQLDSSGIEDAAATIEHTNSTAQEGDKRSEWEWMTALGLITCARIAALAENTPENLQEILHRLNPQAQVPANLDSDWQSFVRSSIYQFVWPKPLSPKWAWDAVAAFGKTPRKVLQTIKIALLLLENNIGITADLTLELIEAGEGILYPNPQTMSFVLCGESFHQSEQNTIAFLREQGLWPKTKDVRWTITKKSLEPIFEINGGSAGGAFALGLAKLLNSEV
jgi:hypothetical protein